MECRFTLKRVHDMIITCSARDSSTSKCPRDNVCSEIPFRVSSYHTKSSHLITIRDKLAGFSMVLFLLKCIYEQTVVYFRKCFSLETCATSQLICNVNEFTVSSIVRAFIERYFQKDIVVCS